MLIKEQVLYVLEKEKDNIVTGGNLAKRLGVSRTAIWKAVNALRDDGNKIESFPNSGYMLVDFGDNLIKRSIDEHLTGNFMGRNMEILKSTHSTNQHLKGLDITNLNEGYTIIADEQTGGRGRMGKKFFSPLREGIYMSILLKPSMGPHETQFLTVCAAVAVAEAIEDLCNAKMNIKWVNDIYYKGKKVCGILTEASLLAEVQSVEYVVLGIGINTGRVPHEVEGIATSLKEAGCNEGIRNRLIAEILNRLENIYIDYTVNNNKKRIISAYEQRLFIKDKKIVMHDTKGDYSATVLGINDEGGLIIRNEQGETKVIISGEIKEIKE